METTARELTDFTVHLLDDLDCADFPARTVLAVLAPRLDAEISNYARVEGRSGTVSMVAPGCSRNGPVILDWCRRNPGNSWFELIASGDGPPVSAQARAGGRAAWIRDPTQQFIESLTGCDKAVGVPLTAAAGEVTGLFFGRRRVDFTDGELAFLAGVQPLLRAVARHAARIAGWRRQCPDGEQAAQACRDAGLTTRELTVLQLMAQGLTATAIARRLGCTPRTAEKHAANLYRKLDVNDRVSAVVTAQRRGMLPTAAG